MSKNPLSSLSYTNKDFTSIYVELLDIVKELSSKWDPTVSNESDPGVILLKADAIIADKANYNIDKNILELYPETVTQELNARNTYKQLGYIMPWYNSATADITFKWVGRELALGESATINKYTMVTNEAEDVVYTILEDVTMDSDHSVVTASSIEGIFNTLTINGSTTIDIVNLDDNNRIYLPDYSIAENGVFVTNVGSSTLWEQVDNLQTKALSNKCYEFGVDSRNSVCYLEFPQDIDTLIELGLEIRYVVSQGESGNMAAATVDRFYNEQSITVGSDSFVLNQEIVLLTNTSACTNGSNPESIQQAYRSYRKTAGTFRTLVTLRDYVNSIYNSGLVSNVIVSDRLNDIQSTYTIKTEDIANPFVTQVSKSATRVVSYFADVPKIQNDTGWFKYSDDGMVPYSPTSEDVINRVRLYRKSEDSGSEMSAFDLKLFLLHTPGIVSSIDDYESTFDLEVPGSTREQEVKGYIYEQQCVQHDFMPILEDLPCLYKNSYPIKIRIVPHRYLTDVQIQEVKRNIVAALWDVCNSHSVEFGEEPNYDVIYDAIQNSDERIKVVILDEFQYTTFATYWDATDKEFKDVPISRTESELVVAVKSKDDLLYHKEHMKSSRLNSAYFVVSATMEKFNVGDILRYNSELGDFELYSNKLTSFREDTIAKSILAGRTPLYNEDGAFKHKINQNYENDVTTGKLTTALILSPFSSNLPIEMKVDINGDEEPETILYPTTNNAMSAEYKLKSNETLRLFAPSLETETTYSNYVKFELVLTKSTGSQKSPVVWEKLTPDDGENECHLVYAAEYDEQLYNAIRLSLFNIVDYDTGKDIQIPSSVETNGHNEGLAVRILTNGGTACLEWDGNEQNKKIQMVSLADARLGHESDKWYVNFTQVDDTIYLRFRKSDNRFISVDPDGNLVMSSYPRGYSCKSVQLPESVSRGYGNNSSLTIRPKVEKGEPEIIVIADEHTKGLKAKNIDERYWFDPVIIADQFTYNHNETLIDNGLWLKYKYVGIGANREFKNEKVIIFNAWSSGKMLLYEDKPLYTIPANTDYQLNENESITFFWRTEDAEDAPYKYVKYTGISSSQATSTKQSPIIRPNFTVNGVAKGDALINPESLYSEGEIDYGSINYSTVYKLYGDNDLSGSKAIEVRKLNQVVLTPDKNNFYFITNKVVKEVPKGKEDDGVEIDQYVLDLKSFEASLTSSSFKYILQSDEYFINLNKSKTEYEILGPGTLIGIETAKEMSGDYTMKVPAVSYQDVIKFGVKAISDACRSVPSDTNMYYREQQMYNIVENDTLIMKLPESRSTFTKPVFTSWQDTPIESYIEISYKTASGEVVILPQINIQSDDYSWCARAYLNLNTSKEQPQIIEGISKDTNGNYDYKSIQMLMLKSEDNDASWKVYPSFNMVEHSVTPEQLYLQSDVSLSKVGGSNIDISYVNFMGERKDVDLYLYSENGSFMKEPFSMDRDNGYIVCEMTKVSNSRVDIKVKLDPDGQYILSLVNRSSDVQLGLNYNGSDSLMAPLNGSDEFNGPGRFYYILPSGVELLSFILRGTPQSENDIFIIDSLFKYTENKLFEEYNLDSESLLKRIQQLDTEGLFKYNNIVTEDDEIYIKDPLDGKSFFNTNHVMNQFTIGKAELRMSDATDSYILPINNR